MCIDLLSYTNIPTAQGNSYCHIDTIAQWLSGLRICFTPPQQTHILLTTQWLMNTRQSPPRRGFAATQLSCALVTAVEWGGGPDNLTQDTQIKTCSCKDDRSVYFQCRVLVNIYLPYLLLGMFSLMFHFDRRRGQTGIHVARFTDKIHLTSYFII